MFLWRACLLLFALVWLAIAAHDVYKMVVRPDVLAWTLGLLHFLFFLAMGLAAAAMSVFADGHAVRGLVVDLVRDVSSRRNLGEFTLAMGLAVLAAFVAAALIR